MKKWLKQINRGLLLGAVLIVATAIYVVVDQYRFKAGKEEMQTQVSTFLQDYLAVNVVAKEARSSPYDPDELAITMKKEAFIKTLQNTWVPDADLSGLSWSSGYVYDRDLVLEQLQGLFETNEGWAYGDGYITAAQADVQAFSPSKNGPNAALFSCNVTVHLEYTGNTTFFLPGLYEELDGEEGKAGDYTAQYTLSGELIYTDGVWRISYLSWY